MTHLLQIGVIDMSEKDSKKTQMNQPDTKKEELEEQESEQVAGGTFWRREGGSLSPVRRRMKKPKGHSVPRY